MLKINIYFMLLPDLLWKIFATSFLLGNNYQLTNGPIFQTIFTDCRYFINQFRIFVKPTSARLAQSVEHETLNLRVVGSSPTLGQGINFVCQTEIFKISFATVIFVFRVVPTIPGFPSYRSYPSQV